jgi:cell division protein FtsI (penicillin-binding protein 3)
MTRAKAKSQRTEQRPRVQPDFHRRRAVLLAGLGFAAAALTAGVFYRQVMETDYLTSQGALRYVREREIPARRGMVLDRNGEPLAVSTPMKTVWADPRLLVKHPEALAPLAKILGLDAKLLAQKVESNATKGFIYLKRRIEPSIAGKVQALAKQIKELGVGLDTEYRRYYPGGEVFGHIVGFTDIEDKGQEGLELAFEGSLAARPGLRRVLQDGQGNVVEEIEQIHAPHNGEDLTLSLDHGLQFIAYRELMRAVQLNKAVAGTAVVLDVATGEVLAMVNQPAFNPNDLEGGKGDDRRNRALTDVMEPGSTAKPLVVAAALDLGKVTPSTSFNTAGGTLAIGGKTVKDVHAYGTLTTTGIITKSSNVGVVKIAMTMDRETLWNLYDHLGFGKPTGVQFPAESSGRLRNYKRWSTFEHATQAFGYGFNVTALQLAQAYAVLAADGVKHPVSLVKRDEPQSGERILKAKTAREVRAMMETVVSDKGTARLAAIEGYRVAGKTGTAKKSSGRHGYTAGKYQSVFAGMLPAGNPRLVMVVMIDEPHGKAYYGGLVAAPVFAKVMTEAVRIFNIPPDDLPPTLQLVGVQPSAALAARPEQSRPELGR